MTTRKARLVALLFIAGFGISFTSFFSSAHAAEISPELACLAKNIYFEARNQPIKGQLAVAAVTLNRVDNARYPSTICGVVHQGKKINGQMVLHACQFSWYCDGKSDRPRNVAAFNHTLELAKRILFQQESLPAFLAEATHYHTYYVEPSWSHKLVRVASVGDHIFYRD